LAAIVWTIAALALAFALCPSRGFALAAIRCPLPSACVVLPQSTHDHCNESHTLLLGHLAH
jgi:hypothetical protein